MTLTTIVPVYNVEKYIRTGLESLLVQGMREGEHEILLIDDGSTDSSGKICDEYAAKYPSLIRVIHKPNGGVSSARNLGIREAKGDYIHFMDADDWLERDGYRMVLDLAADSGPDYIGFKNNDIVDYGIKKDSLGIGFSHNIIGELYGIDMICGYKIWPTVWNYIVRKSFLKEHNLCFNEEIAIGEDCLFNFQSVALNPRIILTSCVIYNYYIRPDSAVSIFPAEKLRKWIDSIRLNVEGLTRIGEEKPELRYLFDIYKDNQIGWFITKLLRFKISRVDSEYIYKAFYKKGTLPTSGKTMVLKSANFLLYHPSILPVSSFLYRKVFYPLYPLIRNLVRKRLNRE